MMEERWNIPKEEKPDLERIIKKKAVINEDDFGYDRRHVALYAIAMVAVLSILGYIALPYQKIAPGMNEMSDTERFMVDNIGKSYEIVMPKSGQNVTESNIFVLMTFTVAGLIIGTIAYMYHKNLYHKRIKEKGQGRKRTKRHKRQ